jgi:hypothetical protein
MSEAELHVLKARLRGGILSKAQRGELKMPLPVGLVYDPAQRVVLDPDKQLQSTLRHFCETFRRTGAAWATVQAFAKEGLKFLRHRHGGSGELVWQTLHHSKALDTLHTGAAQSTCAHSPGANARVRKAGARTRRTVRT